MGRYKLTIEYDGRGFVGWQRQENGMAVQQVLEEAVVKFCGETARLHGAGRTDTGVHALAQVAHVDLGGDPDPRTVRQAINFHARPHAVVVRDVERVPGAGTKGFFHARFSATERRYLYRLNNRNTPLVLDRRRAWWVGKPLDVAAMRTAAATLVGRYDFSTFRAASCQATSPVKTLDALDIHRDGDEIQFAVRAKSFLHHQVRNMVGSLTLVGKGRWTVDDFVAARDARLRAAGGPTAPAQGLYLVEVLY